MSRLEALCALMSECYQNGETLYIKYRVKLDGTEPEVPYFANEIVWLKGYILGTFNSDLTSPNIDILSFYASY